MGEQELGWGDCKYRGLEARERAAFGELQEIQHRGSEWRAQRGQWGGEGPDRAGPLNHITELGLYPEKNKEPLEGSTEGSSRITFRAITLAAASRAGCSSGKADSARRLLRARWEVAQTGAGQQGWGPPGNSWVTQRASCQPPMASLPSSRFAAFSFRHSRPAILRILSTKGDAGFPPNLKDYPE